MFLQLQHHHSPQFGRSSPLPSPRLRSRSLLRPPSFDDSLSVASSLLSLHQDVPSTALISGVTLPSSQLQNGTCCSLHRASVVHLSAPEGPVLSTIDEEMCGIMQTGICRFSELTPGQFGLTKQLVLRIALPHISLLFVSVLYAIMGCWILTFINYNDNSQDIANYIIDAKTLYANSLMSFYDYGKEKNRNNNLNINIMDFNNFNFDDDEYQENEYKVYQNFILFAQELNRIYKEYPKSVGIVKNIRHNDYAIADPLSNLTWNLFFSATTLTSIGYGTNAPDSLGGRLFCLVYISVGIPLYLITMADLAKFCTEGMNRTYTEFLKYKYQVARRFRRWRKKGRIRSNSVKIGEVIIAGGEDEVAEFIWTHLENTQFVEIPFLLIYTLLLSYAMAASYAISWMEGWTIFDAFYFLCSSVLTIGFGDLVPVNDKFVLVTLLIVLVGLVLTTTCVDIVGAYYIDKLHFFGRRLDSEDPLIWLKAVQQKRIEAMKREAFRKLFETITALNHMHLTGMKKLDSVTSSTTEINEGIRLPDPPNPPRNIVASNATAGSVCLKWDPPIFLEEGKRYWYTLTFKTRTPQRRNHLTVIDFITTDHYEVTNLKSFTLYEFSLVTTTRFGSSKSIRTQEYTEPCTVPQSVALDAVSSETATISWKAPRKNNGPESYVIQFSSEPAPQFRYWRRYRIGRAKKFTIPELMPDTKYIVCVSAEHNFGLAAMSKSIRFKTRAWFYDEEIFNPRMHMLSPIPPGLYQLGNPTSRQKLSVTSHESALR